MGPLDRGFESALELEPDEVIRWSAPGMHHAGRTWVGGRIYVSDRRLYFCPGVVARGRHGVLRLPLGAIAEVDRLGRRISIGALGDGGLKPRLQVITAAGERHAFAMRSLNRRTEQLRALLQPQRP